MSDGTQGSLLPGSWGSGGLLSTEKPPEDPRPEVLERVRLQQEKRMLQFEQMIDESGPGQKRRRRSLRDYTTKNCEEAYGGRP